MGLMKKIIVDSNVLLRFLIDEDSLLQSESLKILNRAENGKLLIILNEIVIAECIWVMMSVYKLDKLSVFGKIKNLIIKDCFEIINRDLIYNSLKLFSQVNLSWIDCYLCCQSKLLDIKLATFDEKLVKLCK